MTSAIGIFIIALATLMMAFMLGVEVGYQIYRPNYRSVVTTKPAPVVQGWWI